MSFRGLANFNIIFLTKQCWRLIMNLDSLIARIYSAKYYPNSTFWNDRLGYYPSYA